MRAAARRVRTVWRMWHPGARLAVLLVLALVAMAATQMYLLARSAAAKDTPAPAKPAMGGLRGPYGAGLAARATPTTVGAPGAAAVSWMTWARSWWPFGGGGDGGSGADSSHSIAKPHGATTRAGPPGLGAAPAAGATAGPTVNPLDREDPALADDIEALAGKVSALRRDLAEARRRRDELLGLQAAAVVARHNLDEADEAAQLNPAQRYRRLKRQLLSKTKEVVDRQLYLEKLRDKIAAQSDALTGSSACPLMLVGTYSQGWVISSAVVANARPSPVVYSFGAGKDVSFDLDLVNAFVEEKKDPLVHLLEPDPRSLEWLAKQRLPKRLLLHPFALGRADTDIPFWLLDKRSGSSVGNEFSKTRDSDVEITVAARTAATIHRELGDGWVDLYKVDLDGYEYEVLDQFAPEALNTSHLLLDMHTGTGDILRDVFKLATPALRYLNDIGWRVLAVDERYGRKFTFVRACTQADAAAGGGRCLCCYPDVPFHCVLAA